MSKLEEKLAASIRTAGKTAPRKTASAKPAVAKPTVAKAVVTNSPSGAAATPPAVDGRPLHPCRVWPD